MPFEAVQPAAGAGNGGTLCPCDVEEQAQAFFPVYPVMGHVLQPHIPGDGYQRNLFRGDADRRVDGGLAREVPGRQTPLCRPRPRPVATSEENPVIGAEQKMNLHRQR